jgi:plastocyanin
MKNRLIITAVIVASIVTALILTRSSDESSKANMGNSSSSSTSTDNSAEPNTVTMKNIEFTVKKLTVKKGTTVTWRNDDTAQHDVVFDDASMTKANSPGLLDKGDTHQYTFTETGTFSYYCTPHPFMKAEIEVIEA